MKVNRGSTFSPQAIKNKQLYLRPAKLSDFAAIKAYRQDPINCQYIRPPETDEKTQEIVNQLSQPWQLEQGRWNGLVVCLTGNDTVVGEVAFNIEDWEHQRIEIGYRLHESVSGRGICTQAMSLLISYLIKTIGNEKFVAKCDPRNVASYRVMEKLGFEREAFFKHHYLMGEQWTDQYDYGLLAKNWLTR